MVCSTDKVTLGLTSTWRKASTTSVNYIFIKGYKYRRLRKAPYLSDYHKLLRLNWCLLHKNANFEEYVFWMKK